MGERKKLLRKLKSHRRTLQEHVEKIKIERARPRPQEYLIELWKKQIENIRGWIDKIEEELK